MGEADTAFLDAIPDVRRFDIVQTYLNSDPEDEVRVRRRQDGDSFAYLLTTKRLVNGIRHIELEERITAREYRRLLQNADKTRYPLHKTRYCFTVDGAYVEIDLYPFFADRALLYWEGAPGKEPVLPDGIRVIADVTDDAEYKNANLARKYLS